MFNLIQATKTEKTLTERRAEYGDKLTQDIVNQVARDILDGVARDVAGNRLEFFAKKCNPQVKAEDVEIAVNQLLDAALDALAPKEETKAKEKAA